MTNNSTKNFNEARALREARVVPTLAVGTILMLCTGLLLDVSGCVLAFGPDSLARYVGWFKAAHVVVRLGTVIAFLLWLHARYSSLRLVGWTAPNYTPAVAVGWFFVPLLNLYKPYLVVQEMWGATESGSSWDIGNSRLVLAWWAAFIGAPLAMFSLSTPALFGSSAPALPQLLFVAFLNIVAGALAILVVAMIDERWKAKLRAIETLGPVEARDPAEGSAAAKVSSPVQAFARPAQVSAMTDTGRRPESERALPPALPASPPAATAPLSVPSAESASRRQSEAEPSLAVPPQPIRESAPPPRPQPVMSDEEAIEAISIRLLGARKASIAVATLAACFAVALITAASLLVVRTLDARDVVRHVAIVIALGYVGLSLLSLIPCAQLIRFSKQARGFAKTRTASNLEAALRMQSRFWFFAGVMSLAVVVIVMASLFLMAVTPVVENAL